MYLCNGGYTFVQCLDVCVWDIISTIIVRKQFSTISFLNIYKFLFRIRTHNLPCDRPPTCNSPNSYSHCTGTLYFSIYIFQYFWVWTMNCHNTYTHICIYLYYITNTFLIFIYIWNLVRCLVPKTRMCEYLCIYVWTYVK